MSATRNGIASVVERTRAVDAAAAVVAAHFLGSTAIFVLGEELLLSVPREGEPRTVVAHAGAILTSATDGSRILTGGDDGHVRATAADGASAPVAADGKHRWIDHVAAGRNGAVAWSAGKQAFALSGRGEERVLDLPSTVGGLAFAPKGLRLAVAHYNGVTLSFPNAPSATQELAWKGSHLGVAFSPDGRFLLSSMQEPTLHGWRLADGKDIRLSGYSARVRSVDFSAGGKWLASSGATQLVVWPFQGKEAPWARRRNFLPSRNFRCRLLPAIPRIRSWLRDMRTG